MRRIILLLAVSLAACGGSDDGARPSAGETTSISVDFESFERYESPEYGFAIAHPDDWTVTEVPQENLIGFTAPQSETSLTPNFNVTVTEVSENLPPVAYYEGEIERVQTSLENAEILEVVDVNIDGEIGRGLTLVTRQSGLDIGISRVIVIASGRAYEVSFFALAADLQEMAPVVATIFQSIELLD